MTPASQHKSHPIKVAILAYPNLCLFEFACALEVFAQNRPEFPAPHYQVQVCALSKSANSSLPLVGVSLTLSDNRETWGIKSLSDADLIIVPGWQGIDIKPDNSLVKELVRAHQLKKTIASICSGAFLLGYAGLLDGRRATTHWRYVEQAKQTFPNVHFNADALYFDDDGIITSAGSAAGLDMCLYLVAKHYGQHVANSYAKRLVVTPFREGGQAQFISRPAISATRGDKFSALIDSINKDLTQSHTVAEMADSVNLSERQFLRQFKARFNTTPSRYLIRLRLQRACELLESSDLPVKTIAQTCGLGSEESLRHHFRMQLKTSPLNYRERFTALAKR